MLRVVSWVQVGGVGVGVGVGVGMGVGVAVGGAVGTGVTVAVGRGVAVAVGAEDGALAEGGAGLDFGLVTSMAGAEGVMEATGVAVAIAGTGVATTCWMAVLGVCEGTATVLQPARLTRARVVMISLRICMCISHGGGERSQSIVEASTSSSSTRPRVKANLRCVILQDQCVAV
jgi:hypothetical protein